MIWSAAYKCRLCGEIFCDMYGKWLVLMTREEQSRQKDVQDMFVQMGAMESLTSLALKKEKNKP